MSIKMPQNYRLWNDARKRFGLSDMHVQMARELGMNPKKIGSLSNHNQEPWKVPLPQFIEHCYFKRFGKEKPDTVRSIEEANKHQQQKKHAKKAKRLKVQQEYELDSQ